MEPLRESPFEKRRPISGKELSALSFDEKERRIQREYDSYQGGTTIQALRPNDPFGGMGIEFRFETNAQYDLLNFSFCEDSQNRVPPKGPVYKGEKISTPGDLICGWVDPGKNGRDPEYVNWFTCSEQFLRCWTLIMYDNHETFRKVFGKDMRKRMMSGNRLNTNSYLKWLLGCLQSGVEVTEQEMLAHFYVQRTEFNSRCTVHTYTALALLVRCGELPREDNIPNNADNSHKMKMWSLFPNLLENLIFKLSGKRIELKVKLCDTLEGFPSSMKEFPSLVQEPPSITSQEFPSLSIQEEVQEALVLEHVTSFGTMDSDLLNQLQQLEETLQQQLQIQQLQESIWKREWNIHQHELILRQSRREFEEKEKYILQEISQREQMRQKSEMRERKEQERWEIFQKKVLQEREEKEREEEIQQQEREIERLQQERDEQEKQEGEKRKKKNSKERRRIKRRREEEEKREEEEEQKMKKLLETRIDWAESWEKREKMDFNIPVVF
uniref:Uncharacterized protein n=1 Tax=Marseillevirus LCMAC101 TaxID=2506602 RepID=A0A481YSQ3_9VIRU|nr:MAG: uncharacterized protein LCMAC101_03900 [Marseillevirus LCMAC101]